MGYLTTIFLVFIPIVSFNFNLLGESGFSSHDFLFLLLPDAFKVWDMSNQKTTPYLAHQ